MRRSTALGSAAQYHPHIPAARGVVAHSRIAFRTPVAQRMARARAHQQGGLRVGNDRARIGERIRRQRQVPHGAMPRDTECVQESHEAVEDVLAAARSDPPVREQPLQLARSRPIESELDRERAPACSAGSRACSPAYAGEDRNGARRAARAAARARPRSGACRRSAAPRPATSDMSFDSTRPMIQVIRHSGQARCRARISGTV